MHENQQTFQTNFEAYLGHLHKNRFNKIDAFIKFIFNETCPFKKLILIK